MSAQAKTDDLHLSVEAARVEVIDFVPMTGEDIPH
jgi:hypothetical protein